LHYQSILVESTHKELFGTPGINVRASRKVTPEILGRRGEVFSSPAGRLHTTNVLLLYRFRSCEWWWERPDPRLVTLADNIVASFKSFSIDLSQNETLVISAGVRNFTGNVFVPFTVTRALQWRPQALAC
jgi:hypothetical protein